MQVVVDERHHNRENMVMGVAVHPWPQLASLTEAGMDARGHARIWKT